MWWVVYFEGTKTLRGGCDGFKKVKFPNLSGCQEEFKTNKTEIFFTRKQHNIDQIFENEIRAVF